jgi:hypothetical protein
VLADGAVVGRIVRANAAPVDAPWLWTVTFGHHEDRTPTHGYAVTREAAMTERVKAGSYENRQANRIAMVVAIGGASCTAPVASAQAMNACRTIKDSQKRLACFDAGGRCPSRRSPTSRRRYRPDICCEPTPPIPRTGLVALRGLSAPQEIWP